MKSALRSALVLLAVIAWLALLWFAQDWFTTEGSCDPQTAWDKCESVTGPGPGNGR